MKNKIAAFAAVAAFLILFSGCSGQNVDVGSIGIIKLPSGEVVEGKIEKLVRWGNSNTEVTIDGVRYCVHPAFFAVKEDTNGNH